MGHLGRLKTTMIVNCSCGASLGRPILDWYDFVLQHALVIAFVLLYDCVETLHKVYTADIHNLTDLNVFFFLNQVWKVSFAFVKH